MTQFGNAVQGGTQARSRPQEREMPRETLERIAAQLGSLDGEPLQACCSGPPCCVSQLRRLLTVSLAAEASPTLAS
jgi:hypothetical protein